MSTTVKTRNRRDSATKYRLVTTNSDYARICEKLLRRFPPHLKGRLEVVSIADKKRLPASKKSSFFISRLSDITSASTAQISTGVGTKRLVFLDELPVKAVASHLVRLNIRDPRRIHLTTGRDADARKRLIYRLMSGLAQDDHAKIIVDAWIENESLILLSPSFDRLEVPLEKLTQFIGSNPDNWDSFEIDEDGSFLYWPHADVHLGWKQLKQIVDPASALADVEKTKQFNKLYGAAIRVLREERGLKQSDIPGLTERHLRRIEHGEQAATKSVLEALAKAQGMSVEKYLMRIAQRMSHPKKIDIA